MPKLKDRRAREKARSGASSKSRNPTVKESAAGAEEGDDAAPHTTLSDGPKSAADIVALGERVQQVIQRRDKDIYKALQLAALYAARLKLRPGSITWHAFRTAPVCANFSRPPKKGQQKDALAYVLKLMCKAYDSKAPGAKDASLYFRALKALQNDGVLAEDIALN